MGISLDSTKWFFYPLFLDQMWIWECWFLVEGGKPEYPEKNPRSGDENQQNGITVCSILLCFSKGSLQDYPSFVPGHVGPIALPINLSGWPHIQFARAKTPGKEIEGNHHWTLDLTRVWFVLLYYTQALWLVGQVRRAIFSTNGKQIQNKSALVACAFPRLTLVTYIETWCC